MTVSSSTNKSGPYTGDGATTAFDFAFKVQAAADIKVVRTVTTNGTDVDTVLASGADYAVSINADQSASPGGTVTMTVAPTSAQKITILRNVAATQGSSIPNQGGFYPKVVENALDKLTMLYQQVAEELARALKISVTQSASDLPATLLSIATSEANAASSATDAAADAVATAADRVQTGLDVVATAADRVQTGLDVVATAADRVQTGLDKTATAADRVQTGLDAVATAADRVQTGLDAVATAADRVQTGLDKTAAAASATAAANAYDSFDDRYLGSKAADPAVDNDGNALLTGALYWNTAVPEMRVYTGSAWIAAYLPSSGYATLNGAETLTSKTLQDSTTVIADEADPTKKMKFQVSGVATGQIRTVSMPDRDVSLGNIIRSSRTANTALGTADAETLIDITSGTFTQTFDACANLGNGWSVWIRNAGTGDITLDPNAAETIDGLTSFVMYPGEARLIQCDGTVLRSMVIQPFYKVFTSTDNFIKPPGYGDFDYDAQAPGGGGGGGDARGGAGGGGGMRIFGSIAASDLPSSVPVTIGAAGTGGAAPGSDGQAGGNTSFGSYIKAYGGKGGKGGASSFGGATAIGGQGGSVKMLTSVSPAGFNGNTAGGYTEYAGANGASAVADNNTPEAGYGSLFAGAGGGAGQASGMTASSGGASGNPDQQQGGGGTAGTNAVGGNGAYRCGGGGGSAGNGGSGGVGAGGGGGGGPSGNGGAGGRGEFAIGGRA